MTVINTNTASIMAQANMKKVSGELEQAMERLSSGLRINSGRRRGGAVDRESYGSTGARPQYGHPQRQ